MATGMKTEHQSPEKFEMDAEFYPKRVAELEKQLAECQAQTPLAEGPWEEQAYNAGKKEGQREALLDAKHVAENMMALGYKIEAIVGDISNMAKELET